VDILINWNLDKFPNISLKFEAEKMEDRTFKNPRLVLFGAQCFNYVTTKLCLRNNPTWNKDDMI